MGFKGSGGSIKMDPKSRLWLDAKTIFLSPLCTRVWSSTEKEALLSSWIRCLSSHSCHSSRWRPFFQVETDNSGFATGAVLSQFQDASWLPVALSESLNDIERNYDIHDVNSSQSCELSLNGANTFTDLHLPPKPSPTIKSLIHHDQPKTQSMSSSLVSRTLGIQF